MKSLTMTPDEAAAFLKMSPLLFHCLLDDKEISFHYAGVHKRIRYADVAIFRAEQERRHRLLDNLTAQAQELNMGY